MRVLVTGGAGFVGSHLVDAFLTRGADVTVVDDLSRGRAGRVDPRAALHKVSVVDADAFARVVDASRPDLICHLAAQVDVRASVTDPVHDAAVNVVGTVNVLRAARTARARVLFASSGGALYGRDAPIPSAEDVPPAPESPYGVAKLCAEQYVALDNRVHGTRHGVLRLANVYGPRQDPTGEAGVVAVFCAAVLAGRSPVVYGDGTQTRDYVYVDDVVRSFLAAAERPAPGVWNIGTGTETSVLGLLDVITEVTGRVVSPRFAPPRVGELERSAVSVRRAAHDLGWRPATPLRAGVAAVCRWLEAGAADR